MWNGDVGLRLFKTCSWRPFNLLICWFVIKALQWGISWKNSSPWPYRYLTASTAASPVSKKGSGCSIKSPKYIIIHNKVEKSVKYLLQHNEI